MSLERNRELVRRLIEEDLNVLDRSVAAEIIAPDFFDPTNPPGMQHGLEGHNAIVELFHTAFPDVRWTIDDMLAEGDRVMVVLTMTGTHRGLFFGIEPTGKRVTVRGIHVLTIRDGKISEHQGVNDDLSFMRQLGAIPGDQ